MNNTEVLLILNECSDDLEKVRLMIDSVGHSSNIVPYLNRYAIIKACGTIEVAYKAIISDYCNWRSKPQVKAYINNKVREGSRNPTYSAICGLLSDFDEEWNTQFKLKIKNHADNQHIHLSLKSLVDARNEFAHGGNPGMTILDVVRHYQYCRIVIETVDEIVK